jgi:serine protease
MRIVPAAAAALLLFLAAPGVASAATCEFPASAYSTGAPVGVTPSPSAPVNDPIFSEQWGLSQIGAPAAWARGANGEGAVIAVLDTGADLKHPDLAANLVAGTDVTPDDAQGCPGPQDENGHGSHVSGIAAAVTGNGIGVAGTAPAAKVMPVRVLDAEGSGDDATIIKGIQYAADHGADVISMSLGGAQVVGQTPALNEEIAKAVDDAYKKGAVVVAAAGNETVPLCSYPAAADNAICVGATDRSGAPSAYSNFPTGQGTSVGVRAPGGFGSLFCEDSEDIWSTVWPDASGCKNTATGDLGGYETFAGTSMATPYVAGVAAMLAGKGLTNGQILECIKTTSSNEGGFDPVMGYGIVNADAATRTCSKAGTPTRPGAGGGSGAGSLSVKVRKVSRRTLARTRTLRVVISNRSAVTVRLRAVVKAKRRQKGGTAATRRVKLRKAGKHTVRMRISRGAARKLRRYRGATWYVRYRAGSKVGTARGRR